MFILLAFVVLIFSIIIHEVAHGFAANTLGDPTARMAGRLTLNPLPHIDPMGSLVIPALLLLTNSPIFFGWAKPVPYNPYNLRDQRWGEALVAIAGSAANIALALVFGIIVRYGASLPLPALELAQTVAFTNLFLGCFNLIPFPPLDGFTALRGILPWSISSKLMRLEASVRGAGAVSLILFLLVFSYVLAGPFYLLVASLFGLITGGGI